MIFIEISINQTNIFPYLSLLGLSRDYRKRGKCKIAQNANVERYMKYPSYGVFYDTR